MKTLDEFDGSPAGESVVKPVEPHKKYSVMNAQPKGDQPGKTGTHSTKPLKRGVNVALLAIAALSVFVPLGMAAWSAHKPALVVQGEVQATEIKVVPKVVGRVQALHVCKGDKVRKGQLLVSLEDQDLQANLEQARAEMELAKEHNRIVRAACVEDICALSNWWVKAKAVAEHAEQTVNRSRTLHAAKVSSLQELQDSERNLDWARSSERAAKASFDLAVAVFGNEGKLAAAANHEQATRTLAELEALVAELALTSPIDGEVQGRIVGQGELVTPDLPVVSIVDPQDVWVRFNLPEDLLSNIRLGTTLRVRVPALGNQEVPVKVNYISANGGFVTRRAAKGNGGSDLRTFVVRAVPVQVTAGLRSGMSALLTWRNFN
jgi:HlyD family secretion protein